ESLNFSDVVGRFTTGEVAFALARMERLFPGEGWGDRIPDIVDYLVRRKAVEEGFVPDMADHWAAYAFAETTTWSEPLAFDDIARSWARKQMGISSVMIRYESQLTNGFPDRALRGATALGAAVGTHGEAMAGWTTYFAATRGVDDDVVAAGMARLACNIGTLTARQIDSDEAASYAQPRRVEGAWLSGGVTQVDDQQHAMSAVLAGDRVSGGSIDPRPSGGRGVGESRGLPRRVAGRKIVHGRGPAGTVAPGARRRCRVSLVATHRRIGARLWIGRVVGTFR
ncbi:MAG: hypothetical protein EBY07_04090, partial [Actinobacteria bacterium]|nr:hypothetical protein [Actinomycetota bacterium]